MLSGKRKNAIRIEKENQSLIQDPIDGVLVKRDGDLDFHFVIYKLDAPYKNGFYHGLLQLDPEYPFAAPKLFMYTPSGRFEINMSICTSFTVYHQESWSLAWNVRTLLLGTVSFMTSEEGSYGVRNETAEQRAALAEKSMENNLKNEKFCELFLEDMVEKGLIPEEKIVTEKETISSSKEEENPLKKDLKQNKVKEYPFAKEDPQNRENQRENLPNQINPDPNKIIKGIISIGTFGCICYVVLKKWKII